MIIILDICNIHIKKEVLLFHISSKCAPLSEFWEGHWREGRGLVVLLSAEQLVFIN